MAKGNAKNNEGPSNPQKMVEPETEVEDQDDRIINEIQDLEAICQEIFK